MQQLKIGDMVTLLPKSKYPGVVGTVISLHEDKYLVRFNGTQQLYFKEDEIKIFKK